MIMPACAGKDTPLYRMDPRVKVVSIFGFVAVVSSLTSKPLLIAAAGLITGLALLSGMGAGYLLRRIALVLPFTGMVLVIFPFAVPGEAVFSMHLGPLSLAATGQGVSRAAILSLRVLTAVLAVSTLTATTPFPDLMKALRGLRIPGVFVQVLEFTVRYIFVLVDEVQRMRLARKSRCFKAGRTLFARSTFNTLGQMVGVLFVRSWDRGERIYCAMLARGYSADAGISARAARPGWGDLCWGAAIIVAAVSLRLFESGAV
ncbi:MAG: cobalt ECF transporter T component CbiQ [Bacillota bacterium]